jgi:hypothetical protein
MSAQCGHATARVFNRVDSSPGLLISRAEADSQPGLLCLLRIDVQAFEFVSNCTILSAEQAAALGCMLVTKYCLLMCHLLACCCCSRIISASKPPDAAIETEALLLLC